MSVFTLEVFTLITIIAAREAHRINPAVAPGMLLAAGPQGDKIIGDAIIEYFKDAGEWNDSLLPVALETYRSTERMLEFSGAEATAAVAKMLA